MPQSTKSHFRRVEQPLRIKHVFDGHLRFEICGGELRVHQIALFDAHTVLTGQAPSNLDAELQDLGPERFAQLKITGLVGIKEDEGVHIAIPGMEHIGHVEAELFGQFADPPQHEGQLRDRDRAIKAHVVIDLTHRAKGRFAAQPDALCFVLGLGLTQGHGIVSPGDLHDHVELLINLGI